MQNNVVLTAPMKMLIAEIRNLLNKLISELPESGTLILTGDAGTGKSLMIQTVIKALLSPNNVKSNTINFDQFTRMYYIFYLVVIIILYKQLVMFIQ